MRSCWDPTLINPSNCRYNDPACFSEAQHPYYVFSLVFLQPWIYANGTIWIDYLMILNNFWKISEKPRQKTPVKNYLAAIFSFDFEILSIFFSRADVITRYLSLIAWSILLSVWWSIPQASVLFKKIYAGFELLFVINFVYIFYTFSRYF